ncbi:MAG: RsmE family RNA methyltransferase [Cytophagales bacterium]
MQIFYSTQITENQIHISGDEFNHCKNVLRMKIGEEVNVADGKGNVYHAKIGNFTKEKAELQIISKSEQDLTNNNYTLHIVIAPTKNIERMEWFVEKAVEIGINEISFIITKRTERKLINTERLEKIAVSAMKQSGRAWLPIINPMQPFDKYITNTKNKNVKLVAHLIEGEKRVLLTDIASKTDSKNKHFELLIGPEGDFTTDEVQMALSSGFSAVSLGNARLRTETAAIMGCATFAMILNS